MAETLLVVDDEELICWSVKKEFENHGMEVFTAQNVREGLRCYAEHLPDIVLLDIRLPDGNGLEALKEIRKINKDAIVIIITAFGGVESAVQAIKEGAYDYIEKPFQFDQMGITIDRALETIRLKKEVLEYRKKDSGQFSFDSFIGKAPNMLEMLTMAKKIAETDYATVLIQGESGTGKDILAKIIHYESRRVLRPFIEITCSALPDTLIESELFGFEKGAFTDARQAKKGLFELAEGGSVYMDEIGDVKLGTQVKLLRVLEEKTFKRIGGNRDVKLDVRIIAATNRDLEKEVEAGNFRMDLYYRLKVLPIHIPALRERKDDILLLAKFFIADFNQKFRKNFTGFSREAEQLLMQYHWPGNVRELKNVIEHIMILEDTRLILPDHLPLEIMKAAARQANPLEEGNLGRLTLTIPDEGIDLAETEKELLRQAMEKAGGNQTKAARLLNITRDVLRYRIQKVDL